MKCHDCRYWSDLLANAAPGVGVKAMCLSTDSPYAQKYLMGHQGCDQGAPSYGSAIDEPGLGEGFHELADTVSGQ